MTNTCTPDYQVVKNPQGRYSLWPAEHQPPAGWKALPTRGSKADCLAFVRRAWSALDRQRAPRPRSMQFGLMFFGGEEDPASRDKYRLVIESARFADRHDFAAVWLPERHFTTMGCLYPNPALLLAALARETEHVRLRAGSVVLPLHHPLRVAEDFAVVDNLSGGRVEVSFAPGWNPADFAFHPERYAGRYEEMYAAIPVVEKLWHGETITTTSGDGSSIPVRIFPTPIQRDLPTWLTAAGRAETFEKAGQMGANVLTHLFDQTVEELGAKVRLYRDARREAGWDEGTVAVSLHTFLAGNLDDVRRHAQQPFCRYLKSNTPLLESLAKSRGLDIQLTNLPPQQLDEGVQYLFEKFFQKRSLLGTPESCRELIVELGQIGVNEIACLIDFGPEVDIILQSLPHLDQLRDSCASILPDCGVFAAR